MEKEAIVTQRPIFRTFVTMALFAALVVVGAPRVIAAGGPDIWTSDWYPDRCSGNTCSTTSHGTVPRLQINGKGFAVGETVEIGIFRTDRDQAERYFQTTARRFDGFYGGSFGYETDYFNCEDQGRWYTYQVQAFGKRSGTHSDLITVKLCDVVEPDTVLTNDGWWPLPWP